MVTLFFQSLVGVLRFRSTLWALVRRLDAKPLGVQVRDDDDGAAGGYTEGVRFQIIDPVVQMVSRTLLVAVSSTDEDYLFRSAADTPI